MPVPAAITDLSTTAASNSPAGSENVFPDLDNYLRALSAFIAENYANKAPKASPTFTGTATVAALTATGNVILGDAAADTLTVTPNAVTWTNNPTHSGNHTYSGNVSVGGTFGATGAATLGGTLSVAGALTASLALRVNGATQGTLGVRAGASGATVNAVADELAVEGSGDAGISILTPNTNFARILFGDPESSAAGQLRYNHVDDSFSVITAGGVRFTLTSSAATFAPALSSDTSVSGPGGRCAEIYSGTTSTLTDYPVGTVLLAARDGAAAIARNATAAVKYDSSDTTRFTIGAAGTALTGTWRARGGTVDLLLVQRVA